MFSISIPISGASSYPPNELGYNHVPISCFDCHNGIKASYAFEYDEGDICSGCHTLYNQGNFKEKHEPLVCKGCHKVYDLNSFHPAHINVSCNTCHINNMLPDNKYSDCISCHVSGLHSTHIEKSCFICHTDPNKIKITINPPKITQRCDEFNCWDEIIPEINITNETKSINTSTPITNYKRLTIYEILVNIIKAIRDDIYG